MKKQPRRAIHVPSGEPYFADEVPLLVRTRRRREGDVAEIKDGPWRCDGTNCTVVFSGHRNGGPVHQASGEEGSRVGSFQIGKDNQHAPTCYRNITAMQRGIQRQFPEITIIAKGILFLKLPIEEQPQGRVTRPALRGLGLLAHTKYEMVFSVARTVADLIRKNENDPDVLAQFCVRIRGIDYPWRQFCFGPTTVNRNALAKFTDGHVIFIQADVMSTTTPCSNPERSFIKLETTDHMQFRAFFDTSGKIGALLSAAKQKDRVSILTDNLEIAKASGYTTDVNIPQFVHVETYRLAT